MVDSPCGVHRESARSLRNHHRRAERISMPADGGGSLEARPSPNDTILFLPVICKRWPAMIPFSPSPGLSLIYVTAASEIPSRFAAFVMVAASGCLEYCSRLATTFKTCSRVWPGAQITSVNAGRP